MRYLSAKDASSTMRWRGGLKWCLQQIKRNDTDTGIQVFAVLLRGSKNHFDVLFTFNTLLIYLSFPPY